MRDCLKPLGLVSNSLYLKTFSEYYNMTRTTSLGHLLRPPPTDAMCTVLTPEGADIPQTRPKRVGRPLALLG
eukprot:1386331-Amphidinium_carterae.1